MNISPQSFEPVLDIRARIGAARWNRINPKMALMLDPVLFTSACRFIRVTGSDIQAYYDYHNGPGAWIGAWDHYERQIQV